MAKTIKQYVMIILGTVLLTVGVYFFKIPNGFATGGVSGISTIFGAVFKVFTQAQWMTLINILLLILGFILLGKANGIKTVFCSLLFSGLTMVCEKFIPLYSPLTDQRL